MLEQNINSDLIRGHIDTIILKILLNGDNYGYEIMKAVSINSNNEYELKEPSLYTSLKRLEKQGHIISYWGDESQGGRKGMERKRILKNGHIVVKNPLAHELPKREVVIKSGRTLYRFTGSYDGQRALK